MPLPRSHLPIASTPFVGREKDLRALSDLLKRDDVRLVTLMGPGGVGKTRLALQVISGLANDFSQGIYFVSLAPITDSHPVLSTIAQTLDIQPIDNRSLLEQLIDFLSEEQLLVLDNFEHIIEVAPQLSELLATSRGLKILVTSRAALRISGEYEFHVAPLPTAEAVDLFTQRAQAHKPDFNASGQNAGAVVDICQRLDGLPLAIELAAARVKLLPPRAMLSRLENRLSLLTGGPRDVPMRHQSLREALDWSYNLLELGEQRLFRRLGVFAGSCSLEAVEAVCNLSDELPLNVLGQAQALIDQSLLRQDEGLAGEPRLWLLETIREYALEQLKVSGETSSVHRAQANYYCEWTERVEPLLFGMEQRRWLDHLEQEHNNLRAVLQWSTENPDQTTIEVGLRLGAALGWFWTFRGHLIEGRERLTSLLASPVASDAALIHARALALNTAGLLAIRCSDYVSASQLLEESISLWEEIGDGDMGWRGKALALDSLGWVASAFGQFERARQFYERSLALHRSYGRLHDTQAADVLAHLGMAAFFGGDLVLARTLLEESISMKRAMGERWGIGFALLHLSCVAISEGRFTDAQTHLAEGLALCAKLNERLIRAFLLEALAWLTFVAPDTKNAVGAAQILGAADALRETLSAPRPPQWRAFLERILADMKTTLGTATFEKEVEAGKRLSPDEALILSEQLTPTSTSLRVSSSHMLSSRELEVLQLVAAGLTDAQVAEKLVLSVRTVNAHLQSIYNKLGVNSRTSAVRTATEQKLIPNPQ